MKPVAEVHAYCLRIRQKKKKKNSIKSLPPSRPQKVSKKRNEGEGACFNDDKLNFTKLVICSICYSRCAGCHVDELSIYKWTKAWNIKGRFPESWGLRASVSLTCDQAVLLSFCLLEVLFPPFPKRKKTNRRDRRLAFPLLFDSPPLPFYIFLALSPTFAQ